MDLSNTSFHLTRYSIFFSQRFLGIHFLQEVVLDLVIPLNLSVPKRHFSLLSPYQTSFIHILLTIHSHAVTFISLSISSQLRSFIKSSYTWLGMSATFFKVSNSNKSWELVNNNFCLSSRLTVYSLLRIKGCYLAPLIINK